MHLEGLAKGRGASPSVRAHSLRAPGIMSNTGQTRRASSIFVDVVPGFASGALLGGAFDAESAEHRRTVGRRAVVSRPVRQAGAGAVREVARSGPAAVIGAKLRRMGGRDGVRGCQLPVPTQPSHDSSSMSKGS